MSISVQELNTRIADETIFVNDLLGKVDASRYLVAGSELLFIIGLIRLCVGSAQWILRGRKGIHTANIVRDSLDAVLYTTTAAIVAHRSLQIDLGSLLATSAALSVVAGFALQETLGNLLAGLSLQVEHPFQVGDWVSVDGFIGRVTQMAWRATMLETKKREHVDENVPLSRVPPLGEREWAAVVQAETNRPSALTVQSLQEPCGANSGCQHRCGM